MKNLPIGNITSVSLALEAHLVDSCVHGVQSFPERRGVRCDGENSASSSDDIPASLFSTSMKNLNAWCPSTEAQNFRGLDDHIPEGKSPNVIFFPFSYFPGYPWAARITVTAAPSLKVTGTESRRCSAQALYGYENGIYVAKFLAGTYQQQGSKIHIVGQQKHERLCFRVSKADIIFQNLRTGLCQHETSEKHP